MRDNRTLMQRFLSKINIIPITHCWLWTSTINGEGTGVLTYKMKGLQARRVSYKLFRKVPYDNQVIKNICTLKLCVNPNHLIIGTKEELRWPVLERFLEKIEIDIQTECWVWTAALSSDGYGQLRVGKNMQEVHRVSYEFFVGPIPFDKEIDHLCRNRACVNPEHLESVIHRINCERGDPEGNGVRALREVAKKRSEKTHCKYNHPLSGDNLRIRKSGKRVCVMCVKMRNDKKNELNLGEVLNKRKGSYWGVSCNPNKGLINPWIAQYCYRYKIIHLGTFTSAEEAAYAYNVAREYLKPDSKHINNVLEGSVNTKWIVEDRLREKGLIT